MITVEDVNSAKFSNQGFWWQKIDTACIDSDVASEYSNVKLDFLTISKEKIDTYNYKFTVKVDNSLWTGGTYIMNQRAMPTDPPIQFTDDGFTVILRQSSSDFPAKIFLYMGITELYNVKELMRHYLDDYSVMNLPLNDLGHKEVFVRTFEDPFAHSISVSLTRGFNEITYENDFAGFALVNILKTDFQFQCDQSLTVGEVNKVFLGTDSDYKPNGALVGSYTPVITVDYGGKTLPVKYDSTNNDYYFNLDLTDKTSTGKVRFTVNVATNDVLNASSADVVLDSDYELINSVSKFNSFVKTGGVGRLGANIGLTADIAINKDVYIIGNDKSIDLTGHSIIVNSDKSFKAENTVFTGGTPCITQYTDSKVELTDCTVTGCTGIGSVIKCDIDLTSLDNPNDFTTVLNGCTFSDNTNMILHSGDLNVNNCTVDGAIGNSKYPYFLYQVDGTATLIANTFNIEKDSRITSDIGFNSCIFMVGETAIINGLSHSEWQDNGLTSFLESPQFNRSTVDLTYYYDLIMDYITMTASNGYCHAVSGEDFVFKANVTVRRD